MYTEDRKPISWARTHWKTALNQPGAAQVGYMKKMLEKKNWQRMVPDEGLIVSDNPEDNGYIVSAVSQDGDYLMAYTPYGRKFTIRTDKIKSEKFKASWFNPRDGNKIDLGVFSNNKQAEFAPHSEGRGSDWLLVVEKN